MSSSSSWIIPLSSVSRRADFVGEVGGKAATLGELVADRFPIPPGFSITCSALRHFLTSNGREIKELENEAAKEAVHNIFMKAPFPADLKAAIATAYDALINEPSIVDGAISKEVAVRSSHAMEDSSAATFAGQFTSYLNQKTLDDVLSHVRQVWASALAAHVDAYIKHATDQSHHSHTGGDASTQAPSNDKIPTFANMSVLVLRMVDALAAGVAFSKDPISGAAEVVSINAMKGTADKLVGGEITPDEFSVKVSSNAEDVKSNISVIERRINPDADIASALSDAQLAEVALLAKRMEKHYKCPQDVEWAFGRNGQLVLLQSRPIVESDGDEEAPFRIVPFDEPQIQPKPIEVGPNEFWRRNERLTTPTTPLAQTLLLKSVADAFTDALNDFGAPVSVHVKFFDHYFYMRSGPPLNPAQMPILEKRAGDRLERAGYHLHRWTTGENAFIARGEALKAVKLDGLTDEQLYQHYLKCKDYMKEGSAYHFHNAIAFCAARLALIEFVTQKLEWPKERTDEFFEGQSPASSMIAEKVASLAKLVGWFDKVAVLLDSNKGSFAGIATKMRAADSNFSKAFDDWLFDNAYYSQAYDFAMRSMYENEDVLLKQAFAIRSKGASDASESAVESALQVRAKAIEEAHKKIGEESAIRAFDHLMMLASLGYSTREHSAIVSQMVTQALLRCTVLVMGKRLAEKKRIAEPTDIFFLYDEELTNNYLTDINLTELTKTRRGEVSYGFAHPGPPIRGTPIMPKPLPPFPQASKMMEAFIGYMKDQTNEGGGASSEHPNRLLGVAGSRGVYKGTARVVMNERQFSKVKKGDILVCPISTPHWSVLMSSIGAIVTDFGGRLCHSAIVAREFGYPAVVGTRLATQTIKDGQTLLVDGSNGFVDVIETKK